MTTQGNAVLDFIADAKKFIVAALPVLAFVVGADAPVYQDVIAVLTALGVFAVPNARRRFTK